MSGHGQGGLSFGKPIESARLIPTGWLDTLPPSTACLRPYQRQQIAGLSSALFAGHTKILAQAPTGSGKTHTIAGITAAASAAQLRVLILATRSRLVRQLHERLIGFGILHGVVAAPFPHLRNMNSRVQVASVDTLYRRALTNEHMPLPAADVVIFDEAHLATAKTRLELLDSYPAALRIGFTATPARKSGRSLGAAFDELILGPTIKELTAAGMLVPTRIFNTPVVTAKELGAVPKDMDSDFQAKDLAALLSRPKLIGDVVVNWLRIANGKRTLCFAVNKAHGAALLDSFRRQGVAAEMVTDSDEEETREEVIARLEAGRTSVVINCFLMSYGVDVPSVECVVLARPTRSLAMYLQMVGRGLRAAPGKTHCIVIDHGHVVENLGVPQRDHCWTLDEGSNVNADARAGKTAKQTPAAETLRTCGECSAVWLTSEQGNGCPECGWTPPQRIKPVAFEAADLRELADDEDLVSPNDGQVQMFYRQACAWYARRWPQRWQEKPKSGRWWAWVQTRERFQFDDTLRMPSAFWEALPLEASQEIAGWLHHRVIKWSQDRATAA